MLCVNPGRLTKGVGGGTYARVVIQPMDAKKFENQEDDLQLSNDMLERTAVEVSSGEANALCFVFFSWSLTLFCFYFLLQILRI